MFEFAAKIKPLLIELDEAVPLHEPVPIDSIINLTKKHSPYSEIKLLESQKPSILGAHLAFPEKNLLLIYYRPCSVHQSSNPDRTCPECKNARFILAKELSHAFDCEDERTTTPDAEEMLIKESLKRSYGNKQAQADLFGSLWAVELLVRYLHRVEITGNGVLAESPRLSTARNTSDFSHFSEQYCVPPVCVSWGFEETFMKAMKTVRTHAGLPLFKH